MMPAISLRDGKSSSCGAKPTSTESALRVQQFSRGSFRMTSDRSPDVGPKPLGLTAKRFLAYKRYQAGISRRMLYPADGVHNGGYTVIMLGLVAWHTVIPI